MRKKLYALSALAMMSATALCADQEGKLDWKLWPYANTSTNATNMVNFGPGAIADFITMMDEVEYTDLKTWNAMLFNRQATQDYDGCTLEEIRALSGFFFGDISAEKMKVSLAWTLDGEPFFSKEYTPIGSTFDWDTFELNYQTDVIPVDMDEPFVIEAGKEFYVIFENTSSSPNDAPYVAYMDEGGAPVAAGSSYTAIEGSAIVNGETRTFTKQFMDNTDWMLGTALCASLTLSGSGLPTDCVTVDIVSAPAHIKPGETFDVTATIRNNGGNTITQVTATCDVNGNVTEKTFDISDLAYTFTADITFEGLNTDVDGGVVPITVTVTDLNGNPNTETKENSKTITTFSVESGFERNVLIEEHTGTWCGWCVRGIVAMEQMNERYTDGSFIGVAVHTGDEMTAADADYITSIPDLSGAPTMYVCREYIDNVTPGLMNQAYENMREIPAVAAIDVTATLEEDGIHAESTCTFGINDTYTDYRVGYIVVEDNVGPYIQTNYYAGDTNADMGGFENEGKYVLLHFNDVVRSYVGCDGIVGSLPAEVKKGDVLTHSEVLPYTNVSDKENVWIVAMLINATNGTMVNAAKFRPSDASGISTIADNNEDAIEYYNLQGQKIQNPAQGDLVIRRQGANATKVIF